MEAARGDKLVNVIAYELEAGEGASHRDDGLAEQQAVVGVVHLPVGPYGECALASEGFALRGVGVMIEQSTALGRDKRDFGK